jgi:hypothetical protein
MKRALIFLPVIAFTVFLSCQDKVAGIHAGNSDTTANSNANVTYPYDVAFSKFQVGDANQAKMLLELWKDWDNGNILAHKDYFADSLSMFFADTPPMMGNRDTILSGAQNYRNTFSSVVSTVEAIVPLHNLDSSQNFVAVWGTEKRTDKSGKTDSSYLHEVWRLNKDNKFDLMYQYNSVPPPMAAAKKK